MDVIIIGIHLKYLVFLKSTLFLIFRSNSEMTPSVSERPPNLSVAGTTSRSELFEVHMGDTVQI